MHVSAFENSESAGRVAGSEIEKAGLYHAPEMCRFQSATPTSATSDWSQLTGSISAGCPSPEPKQRPRTDRGPAAACAGAFVRFERLNVLSRSSKLQLPFYLRRREREQRYMGDGRTALRKWWKDVATGRSSAAPSSMRYRKSHPTRSRIQIWACGVRLSAQPAPARGGSAEWIMP